jgi:peptide/nickel transport system permease protein
MRIKTRNLPLVLGSALLLLVFLLAVFGPLVAPRDPLESNKVVRVNGEWVPVPYPPFTVPGFPLGSDPQGRDLLSRLLWGIRPTVILLIVASLLRLLIGAGVGMAAGWSTGRSGRAWETAISTGLTVPSIIVALAVITAIGIQKGLPAFLLGLCATGWADTARVVSEQTRSLKQQPFIESARSMGATGTENVVRHVLRHVLPMLSMLLAFEAGATLMTIAALGFLGYYLGGAFWVEVTDFHQQAISGLPELGQMLADSWQIFKPWATFVTGTVVFIAILGFNLVGEGLRRRLSLGELGRRSVASQAVGKIASWVEETLLVPGPQTARRRSILGGAAVMLGLGLVLFVWKPWQSNAAASQLAATAPELLVTGGHLWGQERRDAYGSAAVRFTDAPPPTIRWFLHDESGFVGSPVVDKEGNVYSVAAAGTLYCVGPTGELRWVSELPAAPAGTPALGPADANGGLGVIYVTDRPGGVSAYTLEGGFLWRAASAGERRASSGPIIGPDGTVYYSSVDRVEAVNPDGTSRWTSGRLASSGDATPRLHPNGKVLFEVDSAIDVATGKLLDYSDVVKPGTAGINAQYMIGGDGRTYLREGHSIVGWELKGETPAVDGQRDWTYQTSTVYQPFDSGVSPLGTGVLIYGSQYDDLRVVQLAADGRLVTNLHWGQKSPKLVATDLEDRAYVCGASNEGVAECIGVRPGENGEPRWRVKLDKGGVRFAGAALVPGRLYVNTEEGWLYAVGE